MLQKAEKFGISRIKNSRIFRIWKGNSNFSTVAIFNFLTKNKIIKVKNKTSPIYTCADIENIIL